MALYLGMHASRAALTKVESVAGNWVHDPRRVVGRRFAEKCGAPVAELSFLSIWRSNARALKNWLPAAAPRNSATNYSLRTRMMVILIWHRPKSLLVYCCGIFSLLHRYRLAASTGDADPALLDPYRRFCWIYMAQACQESL